MRTKTPNWLAYLIAIVWGCHALALYPFVVLMVPDRARELYAWLISSYRAYVTVVIVTLVIVSLLAYLRAKKSKPGPGPYTRWISVMLTVTVVAYVILICVTVPVVADLLAPIADWLPVSTQVYLAYYPYSIGALFIVLALCTRVWLDNDVDVQFPRSYFDMLIASVAIVNALFAGYVAAIHYPVMVCCGGADALRT